MERGAPSAPPDSERRPCILLWSLYYCTFPLRLKVVTLRLAFNFLGTLSFKGIRCRVTFQIMIPVLLLFCKLLAFCSLGNKVRPLLDSFRQDLNVKERLGCNQFCLNWLYFIMDAHLLPSSLGLLFSISHRPLPYILPYPIFILYT